MADSLNVTLRQEYGKRRIRRLRSSGKTPAVLYGHEKDNISLSLPTNDLMTSMRHGIRLFELQGGTSATALLRDVQWDTFGLEVLHVDLVRVSADQKIDATLAVELRGVAPGVSQGGVVEHLLHEVSLTCAVSHMPDKLELNINSLELGQSFTAADLSLPDGAEMLTPLERIIVQCVEPQTEEDEDEVSTGSDSVEPEVIGKKDEDEGETSGA